jgi:beta-glucanase (GH16 family)
LVVWSYPFVEGHHISAIFLTLTAPVWKWESRWIQQQNRFCNARDGIYFSAMAAMQVCLKRAVLFAILSGSLSLTAQVLTSPDRPTQPARTHKASTLVWSDEFNGTDGTSPDPTKWTYDIGNNGWGNNELENYTSNTANVQQKGGNLVITAIKTGTNSYTSARIRTQGLFDHLYGRVEARIKIPYGQGIWPAFWMLGNDIATNPWPKCGEIDIMENIGKEPTTIHGTIHGPGYSGDHGIGSPFSFPNNQKFSDDFHIYAIEWEPTQIRFYVDDNLYATRTSTEIPAGASWVYTHNFFIILNVAVGGGWPGNPDATTVFPQQMLVDYVRVYDLK